jgi:hypothetical protein
MQLFQVIKISPSYVSRSFTNRKIAGMLAGLVFLASGAASSAKAAADLDGAAGKIYDFNLQEKQFRFLKQDVAYDTETGKGQTWHTVNWTDDTIIRRYEPKVNLKGMKDRVIAELFEIDAKNAIALKEGRSFKADRMVLRPDLKVATGVAADGRSVVGWFTPRNANFSRDGVLKLDGKEIPAGAKYGGIRISVQTRLGADALTKGAWKTTLTGKMTDQKWVATQMLVEPLADRLATDVTGLPRVLSVGDSISINYEGPARAALKGKANYHRIEDNCWSTVRGMAFMAYWLGDYTRKDRHWDVILFNSGMHDMKQKTLDGGYAVSLEAYKKNLRKEISIMKKTGATLVFVTTTPVPNTGGSEQYAYRVKGAERDFNRAAREVLRDYQAIQILDLCKVVSDSSKLDTWRKGKDVHYWKAEEQVVLGKAVAEAVITALDARK